MQYRKKPVVIDAERYDGTASSVERVMGMRVSSMGINNSTEGLYITTLEGTMKADIGDWVIKGIRGELYPCKNDIFDATYELV